MGKSKKKGKKGNNFYKQQNKKPTTVKTEAVASNDEAFEREIETEKIKIVDCLLSRGIKHVPIEDFTSIGQTYPPTKPIEELFEPKNFPQGEIMDHPLEINANRRTSQEHLESEQKYQHKVDSAREGAEIHRQVRSYIQRIIKPGMRMIDICRLLENKNRELINIDPENPLKRSIGFPTGVSLNNVAAHYTPNSDDNTVLKEDDIVKIDFGTQINGFIIDCAFTVTFNSKYDQFVRTVQEATEAGIKQMGIDVRLCDIGRAVSEVMISEVEIGDDLVAMKPIKNLNGHSIGEYTIHAGKTVPLYDNHDETKMEEGEMYAIETFGTTGSGLIKDSSKLEVSHYMKNQSAKFVSIDSKNVRELLNFVNRNFGNLAFCRRWLDRGGQKRYLYALKKLTDEGIIEPYPALEDKKGSLTAQYEHTILLRPTCKEIVSRGKDF